MLGWMLGRRDGVLRRAGVGGAGRGHAGGRRILYVSPRDLWARGRGAVTFPSSTFFSSASARRCRWRRDASGSRSSRHSCSGAAGSDLRRVAERTALDECAGGERGGAYCRDVVPGYAGHSAHCVGAVGWGDGGDGHRSCRRADAFSSGIVTHSAARAEFLARVLCRAGIGDADCHLRLLGLLQRLLSGRRGSQSGQDDSAGGADSRLPRWPCSTSR